ncbi:hypothetical protein D9M68_741900 [compost metagenome]
MAVDDVVILNDIFTRIEIVPLNTFLCRFKRLADGFVLNRSLFINTEAVHQCRDTFTLEDTHKVVFSRNEELRLARITLAAATSTKLIINTTRFVTLRADNNKSAKLLNTFTELNVGTTTSDIGSKSNCTLFTSLLNDRRFTLVILGI